MQILIKTIKKYVDDLNFDITNLKISVSSFDESEASLEELQERILSEIQNAEQSIQNKQNQIGKIKQDNINLKNSIEEIKKK